jgi:hypothetical protein
MIGKHFGRLFEVGFNIGILAYIQQENIAHNFGDLYRRDLQQLKLSKMTAEITREANLLGSLDSKIVEKWSLYFIQKGFISGLNFFSEYIKSADSKPQKFKLLYYQCSFVNNNSMNTYKNGEKNVFKEVLSQLINVQPDFANSDFDLLIHRYSKKGEFLQADTLMLIQEKNNFKILCVDLSVFSPALALETEDLHEIEIMRKLLVREISYLRSKSVFSNLRIDTSTLGIDFSEKLKDYFTAFKYKDKESGKLIQAGSYAHSFYRFLQEISIISDMRYYLMWLVTAIAALVPFLYAKIKSIFWQLVRRFTSMNLQVKILAMLAKKY